MEQLLKKVEAYSKTRLAIMSCTTKEHKTSCKLLINNFMVLFNDNSLTETLTEMLDSKVVN